MIADWLHLAGKAALAICLACGVVGYAMMSAADQLKGHRQTALGTVGAVLYLLMIVVYVGSTLGPTFVHGPAWLRLLPIAPASLALALLIARRMGARRMWLDRLGRAFLVSLIGSYVAAVVQHDGLGSIRDTVQTLAWFAIAAALAAAVLAPLVWLCRKVMRRRDGGDRTLMAGLIRPTTGENR